MDCENCVAYGCCEFIICDHKKETQQKQENNDGEYAGRYEP